MKLYPSHCRNIVKLEEKFANVFFHIIGNFSWKCFHAELEFRAKYVCISLTAFAAKKKSRCIFAIAPELVMDTI